VRKRTAGTCSTVSTTQTSRFYPFANRRLANLGYSVSGFQFVGLTTLQSAITRSWRVIYRLAKAAASTFQYGYKWGLD
jgi:hypothetical protein